VNQDRAQSLGEEIALAWLVAGGLACTLGAVIFHFDGRLRYGHFMGHLFVLAGTTCHFVAVLLQAA